VGCLTNALGFSKLDTDLVKFVGAMTILAGTVFAAVLWSQGDYGKYLREMLFYPGAPFSDYYLDKLHGLALAPPRALTFECLGTRHVLRDAKSMAEFLNLINSATSVDRHHSHPLKPCTFQFADDPQIYMLSKDSYIQDEFWLETISDKRSPQDPFNDSIISQFRSSQLRPWLLKHDMELSSEQAPPELIFYYDLHRKAPVSAACSNVRVSRDATRYPRCQQHYNILKPTDLVDADPL